MDAKEALLEIYKICLEQYGIAGAYKIAYYHPLGGIGYVTVYDKCGGVIADGTLESVLHQARQW